MKKHIETQVLDPARKRVYDTVYQKLQQGTLDISYRSEYVVIALTIREIINDHAFNIFMCDHNSIDKDQLDELYFSFFLSYLSTIYHCNDGAVSRLNNLNIILSKMGIQTVIASKLKELVDWTLY